MRGRADARRRPARTAACASPLTPRAASCDRARLGRGRPTARPRAAATCGTGVASNSTVIRSTPAIAVDQRVVGLGDQREAAALEPLDEPRLPQRLRAVQPLRVDARGQRAQLLLRARLRQRRVAHVVLEVEARVVDPDRPAGLQRRERELVPVARHEVQPRPDVGRGSRRTPAPGPRRSAPPRRACGCSPAPAPGTRRRRLKAGLRAPAPFARSVLGPAESDPGERPWVAP